MELRELCEKKAKCRKMNYYMMSGAGFAESVPPKVLEVEGRLEGDPTEYTEVGESNLLSMRTLKILMYMYRFFPGLLTMYE